MRRRLAVLFFLFALSSEGLLNKPLGAELALALSNRGAQGQALPLQNKLSRAFLFATLNPDGVNNVSQRRKRRGQRRNRRGGKVFAIKVMPEDAGASSPPPPPPPASEEAPNVAAPPPVQASPEMGAPGQGRAPTPAKKSAPRVKPPTVMIKPPTE